MKIQLGKNETLEVSVEGEKHQFHINAQLIKQMGKRLTHGLTDSEIELLRQKKKILAVKEVRLRSGCNLMDAKKACEDYAAKAECCAKWPYCECFPEFNELHRSKVIAYRQAKVVHYEYNGILTEVQCQAVMRMDQRPVDKHGFFNYRLTATTTKWCCNV